MPTPPPPPSPCPFPLTLVLNSQHGISAPSNAVTGLWTLREPARHLATNGGRMTSKKDESLVRGDAHVRLPAA